MSNRIIKFRGISKSDGTWFIGNLNIEFDGTHNIYWWENKCVDAENNAFEPVQFGGEVIPETVGQYFQIGSGIKVYEGDLLEVMASIDTHGMRTPKKMIARIRYSNCISLASVWHKGEWYSPRTFDWTDAKLIGNIHEHPELLK